MEKGHSSKFEHAVTERLEPYRAELVASLRRLVAYQYVPPVAHLHFEVYCDQFIDSFPVNVYYLDDNDNECAQANEAYPDVWDLVETEGVLDLEFVEQEEFAGLDTMTASGLVLIAWFADCWQVAGGRDFPLKATIALHAAGIYDAGRFYDLMRATWEQGSAGA